MKAGEYVLLLLLIVIGVGLVLLFAPIHKPSPVSGNSSTAAEINLLSQAIEAYRSDQGHYPSDPETTEKLRPNVSYDPQGYLPASAFLYRSLKQPSAAASPAPGSPRRQPYLLLPSSMLRKTSRGVVFIVDPLGNSIGYSTFKSVHPESPDGFNATFDLWSTGSGRNKADVVKWTKNW